MSECLRSTPRSGRCSRSTSAGSSNSIPGPSGSRKSPSSPKRPSIPASTRTGMPFLHQDNGINYIYYANPYPLLRVRADPELLKEPTLARPIPAWCRARGWPSSSSTAARMGGCATAGKPSTQLVRHDQQAKLIAAAADHRGRVAAEPARHRLGQDRGGPRRVCLLERLSQPLGDDHGRVVRQHVVCWARSGTPRPTRRWARGSMPARW